MLSTPKSGRLGAAELTKKFKKQNEELVKASSPKSPWLQLWPQRSQSIPAVLNIKTDVDDVRREELTSNHSAMSPSEKAIQTNGHCKFKDNSNFPGSCAALPSFSADSFLKLHDLCSSPSSSIEMIRIYASTYPWTLKQRDCSGDLPLHVAVKRDDISYMVICELLSKSPETAQIKDKNGDLPLFLACRRPKVNANVLRALIQIYPSAAHIKAYGNTALHHLLHTGNATPENVKLLISCNPDAVKTPNSFGNLPLHYLCASERPHILTVRAVLEAYPKGITSVNKAGETPIQRALVKNNDEAMRERVRIMLRASCSSALNSGQQGLLRQLNWEARRIVILLCVNLARRLRCNKLIKLGLASEGLEDYRDCKILMDMYHTCDGVWRDIIAFL